MGSDVADCRHLDGGWSQNWNQAFVVTLAGVLHDLHYLHLHCSAFSPDWSHICLTRSKVINNSIKADQFSLIDSNIFSKVVFNK